MTGAKRAYDPLPDLSMLLGASQRLGAGIDSRSGVITFAAKLASDLELPELATAEEIELAIREALTSFITPAGRLMPAAELDELAAEAERGYEMCPQCQVLVPDVTARPGHRMDCTHPSAGQRWPGEDPQS